MEIDNTKAFAEVFKELADYFYNIAPKKEVDGVARRVDEETGWASYEPQRITELDEGGTVSLPVPQMPIGRVEFSNKEYLFIEELNKNILEESDELNRAVLHSVFGEIGCLITPTREMLVDVRLIDEAAVLDDLLRLADFVRQLQSEEVLGYSDIAQYREKLRGEIDIVPTSKEQPKITNNLPSELDTDEAHKLFTKAREIGLMDNNYKWLKGKQLLACFCHDMSQKLNLGKGDRIAWKPFEVLFDIEKGKLRSNYNDIQKTGQNPSDIALVDKVFK